MGGAGLKLTAYLGERDRAGGQLASDALMDICERRGLATSLLLRGAEGFGSAHRMHAEHLLTLSEDLPLVAIAVGSRAAVQEAFEEVRAAVPRGLVTLERAVFLEDWGAGLPDGLPPALKLTIYVGRHARVGGRPAYLAAVDLLRERGVAGASVLLGVDGVLGGTRRRGRLLGRNAEVPLMVLSVGRRESILGMLDELRAMLGQGTVTLEGVRICKRDGVLLEPPQAPPSGGAAGGSPLQKLTVIAGERATHDGQPLFAALVRRLRREGAAGATALRGQWGYHGKHLPHGERFWSLRRHVPVVTVVIDTPENARRWFDIVDAMTRETGLVTSELLPAR